MSPIRTEDQPNLIETEPDAAATLNSNPNADLKSQTFTGKMNPQMAATTRELQNRADELQSIKQVSFTTVYSP